MTFVYVLFIVLAIIGSVFFDKRNGYGPYKLLAYRSLYLLLICIVGFSYGLGGDKFAYMGYFEHYQDSFENVFGAIAYEFVRMGFMPLWTLLCLTVKSTVDSFYVMQFVLALLVNIPICEVVRKHTDHGFIFLLLYFVSEVFFQFNTEVMREGPAIAFGLLAIENYLNGKKGKYCLWTMLALGFHLSAVVLLVVPFIRRLQLTRRNMLIILGGTIVAWLLSDKVLLPVLSYFLNHNIDVLGQKMITYTTIQTTFFGFLRSFLSIMVLPIAATYFNRRLLVNEQENHYREYMTALLVLLAFIGCTFPGFTRFFNYVQIFYLLMLTDLIYSLFATKLHFIFRLGTIVGAFAFWIWYDITYWPENDFRFYQFFVPYTCIINESEDVFFRQDAYYEVCDYSFYEDRIYEAE
ncbi:MAG: EpsG family protein [Paludibacteraceae bacterium]|nr:EpsG family protein [Paludibacteraceae bacterium]